MILNTTDEVKKWFRSIPLAKKEMELRIKFYEDLIADFARPLKQAGAKAPRAEFADAGFYQQQIGTAKARYDSILRDMDRLFELLDGDERAILTAKYLNRLSWDAMEFHVFYSRRQSYRIHDKAIQKLVGQTVGQGPETDPSAKAREAADKLHQLMHCGNERVEFTAAKELLTRSGKEKPEETPSGLDVQIQVVK